MSARVGSGWAGARRVMGISTVIRAYEAVVRPGTRGSVTVYAVFVRRVRPLRSNVKFG
ncbi:hypothetical protein GCM10010349_34880 [Streptomyces flavofungini]|nr:hypothetical protein GCM10010349_34880 [Streptomyces flavofungini]